MKFQGKRPPSIVIVAVEAFEFNDSGARFRRIGRLSFLCAHAFLYDGTTMKDLGTLGGVSSQGFGINNHGQVTGNSNKFGAGDFDAFFYDGNVMWDLEKLVSGLPQGTVLRLDNAPGINDTGQIVASGFYLAGGPDPITGGPIEHAFLLTPVPAPAAVWMFTCALVGAGLIRRRIA